MDYKKEIVKLINSISGRYPPYEVFCDWVCISALCIQNGCQIINTQQKEIRERQYLQTIKRYNPKEREKLMEMLSLLVIELEREPSDVLGSVYMESGLGNKKTGQFFTPFHISEMCAMLNISKIDKEGPIVLNEPSCGGGGMIIAVAKALKDKGIDYQRRMEVVAQDLDWKSIYMCYVQLSLLGIKAIVVQGDALKEPYISEKTNPENIFRTPAYMGILV